jgi:hypothetical protein
MVIVLLDIMRRSGEEVKREERGIRLHLWLARDATALLIVGSFLLVVAVQRVWHHGHPLLMKRPS